jgi:hypothetical protein
VVLAATSILLALYASAHSRNRRVLGAAESARSETEAPLKKRLLDLEILGPSLFESCCFSLCCFDYFVVASADGDEVVEG